MRRVRSTISMGSLPGTIVVSMATRQPIGGSTGTGSLALNANTQTATFCSSRISLHGYHQHEAEPGRP